MEISDIVKKQRAYFATGATRDVDKRIVKSMYFQPAQFQR